METYDSINSDCLVGSRIDERDSSSGSGQLDPLTYDYELERIAMQRAMEIAIYYSHTRPNGTACFTPSDINNSDNSGNLNASPAVGNTIVSSDQATTYKVTGEATVEYTKNASARKKAKVIIKSKKLTAKSVGKKAFKGISPKAVIKVPKKKLEVYREILRAKGVSGSMKIK